jgi:hypothetical protein
LLATAETGSSQNLLNDEAVALRNVVAKKKTEQVAADRPAA